MIGRRRGISDLPEQSPYKKMRRRNTAEQESQGEFPSNSIADKLSADAVKLQQIEGKFASLEKANNDLQMRLALSEAKVAKLNSDLMNKMTTVWDYKKSITETINYVTEAMEDCQGYNEHLTSQYNQVVVKLCADNETLKTQAERHAKEQVQHAKVVHQLSQKESELVEVKSKYQILHVEIESCKKKLQRLGEGERCLQKSILELEATAGEEKRRLESMCAVETEKLSQQGHLHEIETQKFLKEIEELKEKSMNLQHEKNDVVRLVAEKEAEIKSFEQAVDHYKVNVEELKTELAEKTARCQRADDEMVKCEGEMLEKNKQISQLTQQLETIQLDLSRMAAALASVEEAKRDLEREIAMKELQSQETQAKCGQVETELRRQLAILQENLSQRTSELQELQNKWKETDSQRESVSADLLKSNLLVEAVQKENVDIKHELTLISSTKEGEVEILKYQLEHLNKQMEERQLKFNAESQEMKLKYEEIEVKYQNEMAANKQNCENFTAELINFNTKLQQLQELNKQYLEDKEKFNEQFNSSEEKLKNITKSNAQLKETLQVANKNLKLSEQTIEDLNQKNQQLEIKNKDLMEMEEKLKTAEQKAEEFQQKYFNEKIRKMQKELDALRLKHHETNDQRFLTRRQSCQKHQENLQASGNRAHEFQQKYCALHARQENEIRVFDRQQRLLEEANRKAQEFEWKFKELQVQRLNFNRKLSAVCSDEAFPPEVVEMSVPQTLEISSMKRVSSSSKISSIPIFTFRVPVPQKPPQTPESNNEETEPMIEDLPRSSSSPDSFVMIVEDSF
ncbi:restin homolog [Diachasma alloeum]|uniref:restin homolog n=1 Tax=Diachasma alloeum TaxID=454923 RepID=UPI0007384779|nr:restin homolog [Diachasma alloeum]